MQDEQLVQVFNGIVGSAASSGAGVTAVRVVRDAKTNIGKGFAFVEFGSKHGMLMALSQVSSHVPPSSARESPQCLYRAHGSVSESMRSHTHKIGPQARTAEHKHMVGPQARICVYI